LELLPAPLVPDVANCPALEARTSVSTLTAPTAVQPKPAGPAASAVRFYPPPGSRPLPEGRKVVHGYIRSTEYRLSYVDAVRREFGQFCRTHSLHLSLLFIDDGEPCKRHGFLSLCQVLETGEAYGALILHPRHLSHHPVLVAAFADQIRATGAELLSVRGELPPARRRRP
jgi:hypothetical protein